MSVSLNHNKQQVTLGYHIKHEAADLIRIGLTVKLNIICAHVWKFGH
jgi:hypothetical protein